jgi:hypothetical protein
VLTIELPGIGQDMDFAELDRLRTDGLGPKPSIATDVAPPPAPPILFGNPANLDELLRACGTARPAP